MGSLSRPQARAEGPPEPEDEPRGGEGWVAKPLGLGADKRHNTDAPQSTHLRRWTRSPGEFSAQAPHLSLYSFDILETQARAGLPRVALTPLSQL